MAHPKTNSQVFSRLTLKPFTNSFLGSLLKPKPKCFDGQTLKPIPLKNIPHFPSKLSQELDEDEVLFLSHNQLSQELQK